MFSKEKYFILVLSFVVGMVVAFAGLLLKFLIHTIEHLLTQEFEVSISHELFLVYPMLGILITMLFVNYIVRDNIGHGITRILFAIARKQSSLRSHNTWTSIVASAITIGFGGSVGAEAPIVLTGSAIGSNLGRLFRLRSKRMMLLVGCGAAAAIAGVFKAPIAGLVFVVEVLMIDLTMGSLLPLLVSSVTAVAITLAFTDNTPLFAFVLNGDVAINRIPANIALGIFCGFVALYFTRSMNWMEDLFARFTNKWVKWVIGGLTLSLLIYLFPSLYGEGYGLIDLLLSEPDTTKQMEALNNSLFYGHANLFLVYLFLLMLFKVFATTATNCGGGCGGTFAPSLFLGCVTGFFFASIWNIYTPFGIQISLSNFALLGMCGVMSAVMHAPLTGIFLIAELTRGYGLFVPLMVVSVGAYLTIIIFEPHSIYTHRLARRGELLTHHKDRAILTLMSMDSVIERYEMMLEPDMTLARVVSLISQSRYNVFPVVNKEHHLVGVLYIDDIRHIMFRTELHNDFRVAQLMKPPYPRLDIADSMETVVKVFDESKNWTLPVVDRKGAFQGFIRRSAVFKQYRQMMADISQD